MNTGPRIHDSVRASDEFAGCSPAVLKLPRSPSISRVNGPEPSEADRAGVGEFD